MIVVQVTVNGLHNSYRRWSAVPRVGEEMLVEVGEKIKKVVVERVTWGVTAASRLVSADAEVEVSCIWKGPK